MTKRKGIITLANVNISLVLLLYVCRLSCSEIFEFRLSKSEEDYETLTTNSSLNIFLSTENLKLFYGFSIISGHLEWKKLCGRNDSVNDTLRQVTMNAICGNIVQFRNTFPSSLFNLSLKECYDQDYKIPLFGRIDTDMKVFKNECQERKFRNDLFLTIAEEETDIPEKLKGSRGSEFVLQLNLADSVCVNGTCDWKSNIRDFCLADTPSETSDELISPILQSPMMLGGSLSCSLVIVKTTDTAAPHMTLLTYVNNSFEPTQNVSPDLVYIESDWSFMYYKIGRIQEPFAVQIQGDVCESNISLSSCKEFNGEFAKYGCIWNGYCAWFYNKKSSVPQTWSIPSARSIIQQKKEVKSLFSPSLPMTGPQCALKITSSRSCFTAIAHNGNSQFRLSFRDSSKRSHSSKKEYLALIGRTDGGLLIQAEMENSCSFEKIEFVNCSEDNEQDNRNLCNMESTYKCNTGICIKKDAECDLVKDCLDGDDENKTRCSDRVSEWNCNFENIDHREQNCRFLVFANGNPVSGDSGKCNLKLRMAKDTKIRIDHTLNLGTGHFLHLDHTRDKCSPGIGGGSIFTNTMQPGNLRMKFPEKCEVILSVAADASFGLMIKWGIHICDVKAKSCDELTKFKLTEKSWKTYKVKIPQQNVSFRLEIFAQNTFSGDSIAFDDIFFNPECFDYEQTNVYPVIGNETELKWLPHIVAVGTAFVVFVILFIVFCHRNCYILKHVLNFPCTGYLPAEKSDSVADESLLPSAPQCVFGRIDNLLTEKNPNYAWYSERCLNYFIKMISPTRLRVQCMLGGGQFGEVYKGILISDAPQRKDQIVAIKKLLPNSCEENRTEFILEAFTLSKFKHKNIVKCIGVCINNSEILMVQEYMSGGDLKKSLLESRQKKASLPFDTLLHLALDIANAGQYLEHSNFIHRDLAARNCFLTTKGPGMVAKIGDFGLARDVENTSCYVKSGQGMLPLRWMPPEAYIDGIFSTKSDVWSYGVLLWEILSYGEHPYSGWSNIEVQHNVSSGQRLEYPSNCPPKLCSLLRMCWETIPCNRPSFGSICHQLTTIKNTSQNARCEVTYKANGRDREGQFDSSLCYTSTDLPHV